jgi:hypothetical protein
MKAWMCETCGIQYAPGETPPAACAICEDERQYVGWQGQRWATMEDLAGSYSPRIAEDAGLLCVGTNPGFAINQRALVLPTERLRILWECTSLVTPEAVKRLQADGGIDLIAISHPHFYSAMVEWSDALGGVPILLHAADKEWIMRASSAIRLWDGDEYVLTDGVSLMRCGGHFAGSTAVYCQDGKRPRGALFPGDALQVVQNRRSVSFMYSYPNLIPMRPRDVEHMRALLSGRAFDDVYGYTWGRNIIGGGREAVNRSFDRYLHAIHKAA